jgi:outer membrane receptor for ferrienterochelin and colicins
MQKIPVHIISGFLGSGKTTFLNHLIRERQPERIFVIENEVGETNIDGALVVSGAGEIVELSAGCLCCSLADELLDVLEAASARRNDYDRLVIETTGIADPSSIVQVFLGDPLVERVFDLQNVICLADAGNLEDWLAETDEARRQLVIADVVLLNKLDTVSPAYVEGLRKEVEGINPFAKVFTGEHGVFPIQQVLATELIRQASIEQKSLEISHQHHHLHHDITTFTLTFTEPFKLEMLVHEVYKLINIYKHQVYRIKGIVAAENCPSKVVIQSVRNSFALADGSPWQEGEVRQSKIVFIGKGVQRSTIERIFSRHLVPPVPAATQETSVLRSMGKPSLPNKLTGLKLTCLLLLMAIIGSLQAQMQGAHLHCKVIADDQPLEFANVFLPSLQTGEATDSFGMVAFDHLPPGEYEVEASFAGYFSQKKKITLRTGEPTSVEFRLTALTLEEVVVTGAMREVRRSQSPIPVDVVSSKLFLRNPTPNLFESVGMVSGVQPVINCNVCNTGDIQINGIEGVYTQVLLDGMPIVSGLGTVYGLMGIPNNLVDRIEVVKGPAGTLYGSEAMAGQINIITKDAVNAPRLSLDLFGTTWGELNLDAGAKYGLGKSGNGLLGVNGFWFDNPLDKNEDGFTDLAQQKRISVFNKWQWKRLGNKAAQLGARYVWEDRWGGETNWTSADRGSDQIYGESIFTNRLELFGTYQLPLNAPIFLQASYNFHQQDSYYGDTRYDARQDIGFVQAYLDKNIGKHRLLTGAALRHTLYDDNTPATASANTTALPGVFVQDEVSLGKNTDLLGGLRLDWHPTHKAVWSPRLALHQHLGERQSIRFSMGSGFRVVSLFTEDHAALSGAREVVLEEALDPERSWSTNLNYSLQVPTKSFFLNFDASAFYTRFSNRIVPDYDTDPQKIIYANLDGKAVTRGVTLQVDYSDGLPLRLNTGITYMDVFTESSDDGRVRQIRAPRWSGTMMANYTHPGTKLSLDLTGNWFGPQRLPTVPDDFRPEYSPWFAILNLQVSRKFKHGIELYGGVKNLLDFVPDDPILRPFDPFDRMVDDPVNNPNGYTFDPSYNYAPLQGVRGFVGARWRM